MNFPRKIFSLAVLAAGWALLQPASAEAARPSAISARQLHKLAHARQLGDIQSPDLGFGTVPLPLNPALVRLYDRNHRHQGMVPPPIPGFLLLNPLPPFLASRVGFRQAFALELARERALRSADGTSGGIFFQPPLGTPYTPVRNLNLFTYLPVFRILGG
jgi:hypothetical protein